MGFRSGDETVTIEAVIKITTAKAHLVEPTMGPTEVWIPKSQIINMEEPDEDGLRSMLITEWFAKKAGL